MVVMVKKLLTDMVVEGGGGSVSIELDLTGEMVELVFK